MSRISFAVGDFVRLGLTGGRFRVWRVAGVYLGGVNQESVVGLESLDLKSRRRRRSLRNCPVGLFLKSYSWLLVVQWFVFWGNAKRLSRRF